MAGQQPQKQSPEKAVHIEPEEDTSSYRDGFKHMMWLIKLQAIVMLFLTGVVFYYISYIVPEDGYYAIGVQGNNERLQGLKEPNLNQDALLSWVSATTTMVMTFGFDDIDERFALSQKRFSKDGWKSFQKALFKSGLLKDVVSLQQLITAIPISTPTIQAEGDFEGQYRWVVSIPVVETIRAGNKKVPRRITITMILTKMPTLDNPMGVGINTWVEG